MAFSKLGWKEAVGSINVVEVIIKMEKFWVLVFIEGNKGEGQ